MTTTRHYDVVVLGRSPAALLTAALLSRRELRVLVLGQGELAPRYRVLGQTLARRNFNLLAATSPVFRRIISELAQSQKFRRLTEPLDPMFCLLEGDIRFEVPPDIDLFTREIEREFPEVRQPVADFYADVSAVNGLWDAALDKEAVWPPGTLLERIETGRLAAGLPNLEPSETVYPLLDRLPREHAFRDVVHVPALFSSHLGLGWSDVPAQALARLHGSWTRGVHSLLGGEGALEDFLIDRIQAHGGTCRLRSCATEIIVRRGRVVGVREDGDDEPIGTSAVATTLTGEALAELSHGEGVTRKARDLWPRVSVVGARFFVSLRIDARAWPAPLGQEAFLVPSAPELPKIQLSRLPDGDAIEADRKSLLVVAQSLLPTESTARLLGEREAVLATLRGFLPFLDHHLYLVDSPHDGLPAWSYADVGGNRTRRMLERVHLPEASTQPEQMQSRFSVEPLGYLGLAGEPVRGPIPGTFLVGPSVLPALGQEGEVLAAASVASILTSKDRRRQKLRRRMWTKIET